MRDLRFAVRRLLAAPGFLCAAVLTLALGIGANTLTFSAIRGLLLRPLPFPDAGRLVWVQAQNQALGIAGERVGGDEVNLLASRVAAFESVAMIGDRALVRESGGRPEQWKGLWVTPSLFSLLGVRPVAGRAFSAEDMRKGPAPVLMMSYERWQRDFQGSASVIGSIVRFADNKSFTLVGILPRGLEFPFGRLPQTGNGSGFSVGVQDFWVLGQERPGELPGGMMLARLRAGSTASGAAADATAVVASKAGRSFHVVAMRDQALGMLRPALPLLQGFAAFVLLIACANLANLMLARAARSRPEFAVRAALGARAGDLLRIVLAESVLLAASGGACGVALAWIGRKAFVAMAAGRVAMAEQVQLDAAVLLFALLLCFGTTLVFGAVPAGIVWNEAARAMLGRGRTQTAGRGQKRALEALVIGQVALTVVLLTGAALLLQSLTRLMSVDAGYQREHVITADVLLYEPARVVYPFFMALDERLRALPGVEAVGLVQSTPLTGKWTFREPMIVMGKSVEGAGSFVALDYFDAMGVPVIDGRAFQPRDLQDPKLPNIVINDVAARVLFPGETAVGRRVELFGKAREVVGVVKGTRDARLDAPAEPQWYQPILFGSSQLVVRMSGEPAAGVEMLRRELLSSDPRLMVKRVEPLDAIVADSVFERRLASRLLAVFAGLALALALVGLYGVLNVATVERRREFGVRAALGAHPARLTAMVLRQGLAITAAGVGIGVMLSLWFSILLRSLLFEIGPGDPATVAAISGGMLAAAAAACWLPARRAASVDPAVALRSE